jgi:AraC-like DNA-binding protein
VQYRESGPVPQLASFVECVWVLGGQAEPGDPPQAVLPDGRPELVLHFGDPFALVTDGCQVRQPSIVFAGQLASQLLLQPTGRIAVVGIRFHPHGAPGLLREPLHQLTGSPIPLDDLDPGLRKALASIRGGPDDLAGAALDAQRVLTEWINPARIDPRVGHAVKLISGANGWTSIDGVAERTGITRRHLERRFLDHVGLTPKRFARIARFQRALTLLESEAAPTGARTAAECGYADQAHFARDFRALAGCAPSEHLLRRAELTGFFILNQPKASLTDA